MLIVVGSETLSFSRADHERWSLTKWSEVTECIVLIVDVQLPVEWQKTATFDQEFGAALHRSIIWNNF